MRQQLGSAVSDLTNFETAFKGKFGTVTDPTGFINMLGQGLAGFLGYGAQVVDDFSDSGIAQSGYQSKYKDTQWPSTDPELQKCALIFLGCAVTVYYCMSYLYWRCSTTNGKGDWAQQTVGSIGTYLNSFLLAMGYETNVINNGVTGQQIAKRLSDDYHGIEDFTKISGSFSSDYSAFLNSLVQYNPSDALNHPLASCFKLAYKYFQSQNKNANEVIQAIDKIRQTLITHSAKNEFSNSGDYNDLKPLITQLLQNVQSFQPKEPNTGSDTNGGGQGHGSPPQHSPVAPVAGVLSTFGLSGGAAAAYFLDLGGAKTLVNGLLRIG
ncbi:variant erythrocyte surface antigen-1 family protein [Babesia caballi]|uniref:Variant erythrocyte surface antigen-1 family protein n=1 Tax=Babesia caballi TaxID=5871 RepID=A0AAV4LSH0_BABCB|nr:variant erythrocyte surface antigen-1 family protein [Babesia caballi]